MRLFRILLPLILLFFVFTTTKAQRFGGNASHVKWRQINTDTVRVIFPAGTDSLAQRIALVTQQLQSNYNSSIGPRIKKLNIVLQNDVTVSNAYVGLAPYRSEFYLMPPQNAFALGAQNWADNLAIHEYRHAQQYNNFNIGLSGVMGVLFGQNGRALANATAIPDWFFEGDAVYNETLLSEQGRGRLPQFFNAYKSLYYEGKRYGYMQLRNGSYKNYIPNHYDLGYLLVAYGYEQYGSDFWKNVTTQAAAFSSIVYPMQHAIKKNTGMGYKQFVNDAFDFYQEKWNNTKSEAPPKWLSKTLPNSVANYKYPYTDNSGNIIALKTTNKDIPAIVRIAPNGAEEKIIIRDIDYDDYFSYNNNKIIFTSRKPDVRWANSEYSVLHIVDMATGLSTRINGKTKYFSPDISHSGKLIATVQMKDNLQSALLVLDTTGNVLYTFSNNAHLLYSYPKFSANDSLLYVMVRNDAGEMGMQSIAITSGATHTIMPMNNRVIGYPVIKGDTLFYNCTSEGSDKIFAYLARENKHYGIAGYQTGLYQAVSIDSEHIVSSVFTTKGYRLAKIPTYWYPDNGNDTLTPLFVTKPFTNTAANQMLMATGTGNYAITKYPKLFRPFNFHSWNPSINQPDYSFTLLGENVLNTLQSQLSYTYNSNERYNSLGYTAIYGGTYIQPYIDITQIWNRNAPLNADTTVYWNEFKSAAGLQLPFNLSSGRQYRYLTLSASYNINNIQWKANTKQLINNVSYITSRISYSAQIQKSLQQIYPHWAHSYTVTYRRSVNNLDANQLLLNTSFYLPGFAKTHSLVVQAAYQSRDTNRLYIFTNNFPLSRGYEKTDYPRMFKIGVNYHFPIWYPDKGFGNMVFVNRIRANVFYDYTNLKSLRLQTNYPLSTAGAEIYLDTKWWNQQSITIGLRYSKLLNHKLFATAPNRWEIILPVALF
ncbi:hypothetical protein [Limnovirga soli]|uniref:Uncharacterized protein n=1 Tax=Limnovirga soli TaxID=2656915 RepID=A0A8J8JVU0_9BACT|nr:hypothetical protein [Limnovirga soli]NNV54636.1 hypothetical protein [Limnovirga soli]